MDYKNKEVQPSGFLFYVYVNKCLNPSNRNFYPAPNEAKILNNHFPADLVWCLGGLSCEPS